MIYPQRPPIQAPTIPALSIQKDKPSPPSEEHLRVLLLNGMAPVVQQLIDTHGLKLRIENGELKDSLPEAEIHLKKFITVDEDTVKMKEDALKLSKCDDEVLILGDTGTGKEIIARSMIGSRVGRFIAINCAGLPENLIESELFGHAKGSFTGADATKKGLLEEATKGVIFLDEIGELPISVQAKLLRALQDKKIRRVGSNEEKDIDCKFVFATHRKLKQMVDNGTFRKDLYARISTFELHIKSLEERMCDVEPICLSILGGKEFIGALSSSPFSIKKLDLTFNVRSLQKYIKRYKILGRICVDDK